MEIVYQIGVAIHLCKVLDGVLKVTIRDLNLEVSPGWNRPCKLAQHKQYYRNCALRPELGGSVLSDLSSAAQINALVSVSLNSSSADLCSRICALGSELHSRPELLSELSNNNNNKNE